MHMHDEYQSLHLNFPKRETKALQPLVYVSLCYAVRQKDQGLKFYDSVWNNKRHTLSAEKYSLLILHQRRI